TAIIVGGPSGRNPFGHVALAFTGQGVYSFGTEKTTLGMSLVEYLTLQLTYRDSTVYIIDTSPEQEQAMVDYLNGLGPLPDWYKDPFDTCSTRTESALAQGGIDFPSRLGEMLWVPTVPGDLAIIGRRLSTAAPAPILQGTEVPSAFFRFSKR